MGNGYWLVWLVITAVTLSFIVVIIENNKIWIKMQLARITVYQIMKSKNSKWILIFIINIKLHGRYRNHYNITMTTNSFKPWWYMLNSLFLFFFFYISVRRSGGTILSLFYRIEESWNSFKWVSGALNQNVGGEIGRLQGQPLGRLDLAGWLPGGWIADQDLDHGGKAEVPHLSIIWTVADGIYLVWK